MSLTNEDREALVAAFMNSTRNPGHLAFLASPVIEQIVARHVAEARAAALSEAADAIGRQRVLLDCADEGDRDMTRSATYVRAARIVRNLAATPPP